MSVVGKKLTVPTSTVPAKELADKPLIMDQYPPLTCTQMKKRLRMYNATLNLIHNIINSELSYLD